MLQACLQLIVATVRSGRRVCRAFCAILAADISTPDKICCCQESNCQTFLVMLHSKFVSNATLRNYSTHATNQQPARPVTTLIFTTCAFSLVSLQAGNSFWSQRKAVSHVPAWHSVDVQHLIKLPYKPHWRQATKKHE